MFGRERVELIQLEILGTFHDTDAAQRYGGDDSAFAPANGAVATPRIDDAIGQVQLQFDGTAVASRPMPGLYGNSANFF